MLRRKHKKRLGPIPGDPELQQLDQDRQSAVLWYDLIMTDIRTLGSGEQKYESWASGPAYSLFRRAPMNTQVEYLLNQQLGEYGYYARFSPDSDYGTVETGSLYAAPTHHPQDSSRR